MYLINSISESTVRHSSLVAEPCCDDGCHFFSCIAMQFYASANQQYFCVKHCRKGKFCGCYDKRRTGDMRIMLVQIHQMQSCPRRSHRHCNVQIKSTSSQAKLCHRQVGQHEIDQLASKHGNPRQCLLAHTAYACETC